jgi:hypothetical protein
VSILRRLMRPLNFCSQSCALCSNFCTVSGSHTTHRCDRHQLVG